MKKIITFLMLCCITALFTPPEVQAQSAQTVNESGGAGLNDGLKFVVNTNGALAVYRDNRTQYYNGYDWSEVSSRNQGVTLTFRFSKGSQYSSTTRSLQVCSTTPVVKTGNTYKTSISGYVISTISDDRFFVTLDVTYEHPHNYFMVDYIVRSPRTLTAADQTVHMYLDHDAMILGCDASLGYISNSNGHFVGDYRDNCPTCPGPGNLTSIGKYRTSSSHGFKTKNGFRSYYTGNFSSRSNVNSTLELSNTYTTTMTDDGIAVEFTAGPFTQANQTFVRSVAHCYGNSKTEFDNLVINVPAAPAASTPITINFISADFSEIEGNHTAQNVKIKVSGGILASDQICSFTMHGGTAVQNTDYSYVQGFTIPAGNYSTPKELVLNNITIKDNSVCNDDKWVNIKIDEPSTCNDMLILGAQNSAKITINDNEPRPEITTELRDTVYNTGESVAALNLASDIAGATITWTNSNPAIGLAASGTGNIPSFTATNTTSAPITATITVRASKECTGADKTFTITVNSKYFITYDYNGGIAPSTANPTEFLVASLPMSIVNEPTRTGYTFAGWTCSGLSITTPENPFTIPAGTTKNVALTADWGSGANVYNITFWVPVGIINSNIDRTYTYEDNVSIANPTIPGFTFKGWTIVNDEPQSPAINPKKNVSWTQHTVYGNLHFSTTSPLPNEAAPSDTSNWSPNKYTITYDYDGGVAPAVSNPATYNTLTPTITLNAPTRSGYTFKGWTITSTETAVTFLPLSNTIPTGSYGNLTCKANWDENGYTIAYELNGATHPQTPISYSFTDQTTVADPTLAGYIFKGWTITNSESTSPAITPTKNVTFGPSTVFGNLTFKVSTPPASGGDNGSWQQITYTITYNLNGGTHGSSHPNTYKVTDNVSISAPTKAGYLFGGWTITNDSTSSPLPTSGNPTTTFGPSNGIYGNLTFTAVWSTDAYTITYDAGAPDASFTNNTNPGTYDIEDTPISLTDAGAKRNGYSFSGWNIISSAAGVTIPNGMAIPANTYGNLTAKALWTVNNYNITFTVPTIVLNPNSNRTYTYEDDVTIANPTIPGYTFRGWTIANDSLSAPAIPQINSAWVKHTVYGNVTFSATDPTSDPTNWDKIEYTISYDLNGGTPPVTANPTQYNVQTPAITLNAPTRVGYSFTGWTITSDESAVTFTNPTNTIPTGSYGNLTCRANWGINPYTITYNVAAGISHPLTPTGYTFTDNVTISNPTISGYTFNGWTITNDESSAPTITPTKNVSWTPNTVFGNLTMKADFPTSDSTANWIKNKYAVTYNLNGGAGAVTVDPSSPYLWGTTVTILPKTNGMTYADAMYLGWTNSAVALITTQAQEDAVTPTMSQAGDSFTMPIGDTTFYAVWAIDASGPNGEPDGTPDYKQAAIHYLPSSSVTATSGTYPPSAMFNKNTQGTVAENTGNLQAANKILYGWSTNNVPSISATGTPPANTYIFGASINVGTTDITLYAVWADDTNGNGIPDFLEQPATPTVPGNSAVSPGSRPSRPGGRSLALEEDINRPGLGSSLFTPNKMTRGSDDTWAGWNSEWDKPDFGNRAFADDCAHDYVFNMDTLMYSRTNSGFSDYFFYYESWVDRDSWLIWSFDGDWNSERDSFLINLDDKRNGSPYKGAGQFIDTVFIPANTILSTDYVWNITQNEAVHASVADFDNGDVYDVYGYYPGNYDAFFKFNPELITKELNGGKVTMTYKVVPIDGNPAKTYGGSATLYKHVYKRFEPTDSIISQYVSPAGKWSVGIDYGTQELKRSIGGAAWKNAYTPLSNWEQLSVNDGTEIRLRDPGDECGKIIYFNKITTPVTQRKVTIHSIDGMLKTYPAADMEHYVEGQKDFSFVISFADEALKVMAHEYYSGNKYELIGDSAGGNTFQYIIHEVVEPIDIYVMPEPASTTSNDMIGSSNVWAFENMLYIRSNGATKANIYNLSGSLQKQLNLVNDITKEPMERGVYVIEVGNEHYKVIIR